MLLEVNSMSLFVHTYISKNYGEIHSVLKNKKMLHRGSVILLMF